MVKAMLGIAVLSEIALLVYCFVSKSRVRTQAAYPAYPAYPVFYRYIYRKKYIYL